MTKLPPLVYQPKSRLKGGHNSDTNVITFTQVSLETQLLVTMVTCLSPQYFLTVNLLRMPHLMPGLALNELAARKRQRVIKAGPREIKNCSCLPSFPPSADEVEAERKAKVPRLKREAAALLHLMNLQPDRAREYIYCPFASRMDASCQRWYRDSATRSFSPIITGAQSLLGSFLKHPH